MSEERPHERERLRRALALVLGDDHDDDGVDRDHGAGREHPPALLDTVARALGSTLDRWTRGAPLRRLLGGVEHDVLTSSGEWVALEAKLGLPGKFGGSARFLLDGDLVAEVPIGDRVELCAMIRAPGPGLYRVNVELGNKARALLGHACLQVVGERPVVLVDGELLLPTSDGDPRAAASLIRALVEAGFELAYFDIDENDRYGAIRDALHTLRLPTAAIVGYAAKPQAVESLGLDLGRMFGVAAAQRLQGKGVPVSLILTTRFGPTKGLLSSICVLDPDGARRRLEADGFAPERERARRFVAARAAADPITWRLDQTTGSRSIEGNAVVAELDNRRARLRLFELIDGARSSIHLQIYIVRPSAFAEELIVKLICRARAGVRVRFMVDALYSEQEILGRINPLMRSLEAEPNIEILALSPIETRHEIDLSRLKKRDHRKLVIIDGERAIVSGRNASDEYYRGFAEVPIHDHTAHERIPWLDGHVELAGPVVSEVQRCFLDTWMEQGGGALGDLGVLLPALTPSGSTSARLVVHHGLADANGLAMYETLLDLAEHHVYIVNDFPIVSTLERAILRLLARGVRVQLLTGSGAARRMDGTLFPAPIYRTLFEHMVKARLEPLMLAGVEVYEFTTPASALIVARGGRVRPYVHAKIMSVDGRVSSIGSANLDATASFWESEANILVEDVAFSSALEEQLGELIAGSFALDVHSEYWQRERAQRAVVGALWPGSVYS